MNQADEAWVQKLYRYNAPKLYKVVLRRLEDAEAAQDIVQEAFLALIEKIELVKCHPNPVGWLMKAVHFLILQTISTNQNRVDHEVEINDQLEHLTAPPVQILSLRDMLPPGLTQREQISPCLVFRGWVDLRRTICPAQNSYLNLPDSNVSCKKAL